VSRAAHRRPGFGVGRRRGFRGIGGPAVPSVPAYVPTDDADLVLWLDAELSARTESGGVVDQWDDLSGNGYHATSTLTARPAYNATGIGGAYPALIFDGSNDKLLTPALAAMAGAMGASVYVVAIDSSTAACYLLEYGSGGGVTIPGSFSILPNIGNAGSLSFYAYGSGGFNFWRSNADTETLTPHKVIACSVDFSAAGASEIAPIQSNGTALAGSQTGANNSASGFVSLQLAIGAQVTGGSPTNCRIGAVLVYKRAHSDAEKLEVTEYLAARWGLVTAAEMATRVTPRLLFKGQSNVLSQLDTYTAIELYDGPHTSPLIRGYKDTSIFGTRVTGVWGPLRETQPAGVGWEGLDLVTAVELVRNYNKAPEVIMVAQGATDLSTNWAAGTGDLYLRLVASWADALATHPAPLAAPVPWVIWIQGEGDVNTGSASYGANLAALIAATRTDLAGMANARWIVAMLHEDYTGTGDAAKVAALRAGQTAVAAADPTRVFLVDPSDLTLQGDGTHYTEATAIEMGKRFAAVIGANP
jgi:hypothetical protein